MKNFSKIIFINNNFKPFFLFLKMRSNYTVLGVMSGTSLDGVDMALINFEINCNRWRYQLKCAETITYDDVWVNKLKSAISYDYNSQYIKQLNKDYTYYLSELINVFIEKSQFFSMDFISSHGHTIFHQPDKGYTLQIGNLQQLANLTKHKVVCDFRTQDVLLGGQGAPLVPIGDQLLFDDFHYCLNLGGFSNISFNQNGKRIAYDVCPVNTVLNYYASKEGVNYDKNGEIAKKGQVNMTLLKQLNQISYYQKTYPKTLGVEFLNKDFYRVVKKSEKQLKNQDILRTLVEHIACQIVSSIHGQGKRILLTGGGVHNQFLIRRLNELSPINHWCIPNNQLIDFKEALIFGLLGVRYMRNEINVLSSVTGAKENHCSGKLFIPEIIEK